MTLRIIPEQGTPPATPTTPPALVPAGHRRASSNPRMTGIDVLRAVAVLCMVFLHFNVTRWAVPDGPVSGFLSWLSPALDVRTPRFFFLLVGVSVGLMAGGTRALAPADLRTARRRIAVRAGVLLAIELVAEQLDGGGQQLVLDFIALWMVLLLPFCSLRARTLTVIAGALAVFTPVVKLALNNHPWDWANGQIGASMSLRGLDFAASPEHWLGRLLGDIFGAGMAQDTLTVLPFLFLGLAFARTDMTKLKVRIRMIRWGALIAAAATVVSLISMFGFGTADHVTAYDKEQRVVHMAQMREAMEHQAATATPPGPDTTVGPPPPTADMMRGPNASWDQLVTLAKPGPAQYSLSITETLLELGITALLLGCLLLIADNPRWAFLTRPFAALGSLALTWYFVHFIALNAWSGILKDTRGSLSTPALVYAGFCLLALGLSLLHNRCYRRDPIGWLSHAVSHTLVPGRGRR